MNERLGDAPVEAEYEAKMKAVARAVDEFLNGDDLGKPKNTGFVLMVFPLNDHQGRCNYMSNGRREDVVVLLREQLARFEGMPEVKESRA